MNPLLGRLQPYPFEKLRALLEGVTPNPALRPINLQIGEPKHATPELLKAALAEHAEVSAALATSPGAKGVDRLAALVRYGRVEIVGGAFYEPILTMIPQRDRVGQIMRYADWLADRFGTPINGMWIPERVWEQSLTSDLADAGVRYTLLDDFHFKNAGLTEDQLHGYYITEDDTKLVAVFPGSERLRYLIPLPHIEDVPLGTLEQLGYLPLGNHLCFVHCLHLPHLSNSRRRPHITSCLPLARLFQVKNYPQTR